MLILKVTAGGVLNYVSMSLTYIFYYRAVRAQGLDRRTLPYYGRFQPYSAYIGLIWMTFIVCTYGYSSYQPFDVESWFIYYAMLVLCKYFWPTRYETIFANLSENSSSPIRSLEAYQTHEIPITSHHRSHLGTSNN